MRTFNSTLLPTLLVGMILFSVKIEAQAVPLLDPVAAGTLTEDALASTTSGTNLTGTLVGSDADSDPLTYSTGEIGEDGTIAIGKYGTVSVDATSGAYAYTAGVTLVKLQNQQFQAVMGGGSMSGNPTFSGTLLASISDGDTFWVYGNDSDTQYVKAVQIKFTEVNQTVWLSATAAKYLDNTVTDTDTGMDQVASLYALTTEVERQNYLDTKGASNTVTDADSKPGYAIKEFTVDYAKITGFVIVDSWGVKRLAGKDEIEALNSGSTPLQENFTMTVSDGTFTASRSFEITINGANDAPTLTAFSGVIDTTQENTEVEVTIAEINAKGDEADVDGNIGSYQVIAVSTGTLKIGMDSASATTWAAGTNETIDATNKAYWTPATGTGTFNAFTVKAVDNDSAASTTAVQATVEVTATLSVSKLKDDVLHAYPVPVKNELTITLGHYSSGEAQLMDITGKVLLSKTLTSKHTTLNMQSMPKGVYVLNLIAEGNHKTLKVVKE